MTSTAEYKAIAWSGKYLASYRLKPTDRWCVVRRGGANVECATASEAVRIAKDLIEAIEHPTHIIVQVEPPQPLGSLDQWRRDRDASIVADRNRVFAEPTKRLFRRGREIPVEFKKRRALA